MRSRNAHLKLKRLMLALALASFMAPAAQAMPNSNGPLSGSPSLNGSTLASVAAAGRAGVAAAGRARVLSALRPRNDGTGRQSHGSVEASAQPITVGKPAGLDRADAMIGAGIVVGVLFLGLWGDVAIGALIVGVALLGAGAALVVRKACAGVLSWKSSPPPATPPAASGANGRTSHTTSIAREGGSGSSARGRSAARAGSNVASEAR